MRVFSARRLLWLTPLLPLFLGAMALSLVPRPAPQAAGQAGAVTLLPASATPGPGAAAVGIVRTAVPEPQVTQPAMATVAATAILERPSATPLATVTQAAALPTQAPAGDPGGAGQGGAPGFPPLRAAQQPVMDQVVVQAGDTLAQIAARYETTVEALMRLNGLASADVLAVGQALQAPIPESHVDPATQLIPDSELVYGPSSLGFNVESYAQSAPGYLKQHTEVVEERVTLTGPQIVQLVAQRYSVDPRLLLAAIEYRGRWLSNPTPDETALKYPAGNIDPEYEGLFEQLSWVANRMNVGYYGWKERGVLTVAFGDESQAYLAAGLNAATAGVQYFLALESNWATWKDAAGSEGFIRTYTALFGDPWARAAEVLPASLVQPELKLPWASGQTWYVTGGPHGGWGYGSAWGAIDFVADPKSIGCGTSPYWVTAVAPGLVVRSDYGEVVLDLDGDGNEQTGWVVLYMHMATEGRVAAGVSVQAGDPIGHPSCEGGYSTGAHLHISRRYNGEWLSAGGPVPFVLGGWTAQPGRREYDGYLTKDGVVAAACVCRQGNLITAP